MTDSHEGDGALAAADRIAFSVVVPAFNEADRLPASTKRLAYAVETGAIDPAQTEFIVVDDGSDDDTAAVAAKTFDFLPHLRVHRLATNQGKGAAVRVGIQQARGAKVAFMDADMAINPEQLPAMWAALESAHVAIGSRAKSQAHVDRGTTRRTIMGETFNRFVNAATGLGLSDTQCGFKAFSTPAARTLFHAGSIDRFAFDVELLVDARRLGLTIAEVPVDWTQVHRSRIRPLRDPASMIFDVIGKRVSRHRPPALPALVFRVASTGTASAVQLLEATVPATYPVLERQGAATVLLPLAQPAEIDALRRLLAAVPGATVGDQSVTWSELQADRPLDALRARSAGAPQSERAVPFGTESGREAS